MNDIRLADDLRQVKTVVQNLDQLTVMELESVGSIRWRMFQSLLDSYTGSVLVVFPSAVEEGDLDFGASQENVSNKPVPPLTSREKEILLMIASGKNNKIIARKLDITDGTVKVHVKNLMQKLNVHSRLQAAVWALGPGFENIMIWSQENEYS